MLLGTAGGRQGCKRGALCTGSVLRISETSRVPQWFALVHQHPSHPREVTAGFVMFLLLWSWPVNTAAGVPQVMEKPGMWHQTYFPQMNHLIFKMITDISKLCSNRLREREIILEAYLVGWCLAPSTAVNCTSENWSKHFHHLMSVGLGDSLGFGKAEKKNPELITSIIMLVLSCN